MADTGNTPTGNPGAGRAETTSAPDPVAVPAAGTAGLPTSNAPSATTTGGGVEDQVGNVELTDADFRKDGNLRKDAVRRIEENAPPRGGERSYNEVTGETTVTTTVGGQTVTFVEEGDTRGRSKRGETGMDSLARASEDAEESN